MNEILTGSEQGIEIFEKMNQDDIDDEQDAEIIEELDKTDNNWEVVPLALDLDQLARLERETIEISPLSKSIRFGTSLLLSSLVFGGVTSIGLATLYTAFAGVIDKVIVRIYSHSLAIPLEDDVNTFKNQAKIYTKKTIYFSSQAISTVFSIINPFLSMLFNGWGISGMIIGRPLAGLGGISAIIGMIFFGAGPIHSLFWNFVTAPIEIFTIGSINLFNSVLGSSMSASSMSLNSLFGIFFDLISKAVLAIFGFIPGIGIIINILCLIMWALCWYQVGKKLIAFKRAIINYVDIEELTRYWYQIISTYKSYGPDQSKLVQIKYPTALEARIPDSPMSRALLEDLLPELLTQNFTQVPNRENYTKTFSKLKVALNDAIQSNKK